MTITVGAVIIPHYGQMDRMREAWLEAEAIGVDRLYTVDHFFVPSQADYDEHQSGGVAQPPTDYAKDPPNFEAITIQAAMCVTTTRPEISCLVHCNAYRNPNLLADMARTMDHLSHGRYVLGIGSGYYKRDFDEYGYEYGTVGSRLADLDRSLEIIKDRWTKLSPPPTRKIPILMAAAGEKVALKIVAKHADEWHIFGDPETMRRKSDILDDWCVKVGRDPREIKRAAATTAQFGGGPADAYADAGFTHIIELSYGPDWDLSRIRDLVAWRDERNGR